MLATKSSVELSHFQFYYEFRKNYAHFSCSIFRYWLLTVLRAGEAVPPKIELKLARLYRTAFTRQQQRHLGLLQMDSRFQRAADERTLVTNKVI